MVYSPIELTSMQEGTYVTLYICNQSHIYCQLIFLVPNYFEYKISKIGNSVGCCGNSSNALRKGVK